MNTALLSMLSSRICPSDRRLPDFNDGKTHANLPCVETWGKSITLFSDDCIVWLFGRWTVMGGMFSV